MTNEWKEIQQTRINNVAEEWGSWESALKDYTILKVYNPMMWKQPDPELDGKILERTEDGWAPFNTKLENVKVLQLTKCHKWYANKMEWWKVVKWEDWKPIQELYITPETSVYDKWNMTLSKMTDSGPVVVWAWTYQDYLQFTTATNLEDWTLNPLFDSIWTNQNTWEKYPISVMKQEFNLYFEMNWKLYKMRLWASYGNFKNPTEWTFLYAQKEAQKAFKESYPKLRFEPYFMTLKWEVKAADKYKYINWQFDSITSTDMSELIISTWEAITNFNSNWFPWVDLTQPALNVPFNIKGWLQLNAWPSNDTNSEPVDINDVPF